MSHTLMFKDGAGINFISIPLILINFTKKNYKKSPVNTHMYAEVCQLPHRSKTHMYTKFIRVSQDFLDL